ncbi:MAG TPA: SusC/RagA family TonB-linked outer membrane protein, partial [Chitinophagaceae bacterium]|nr:SusC/RagA family TonB-linked outer membrane protein [Chitinophagaceae bacterium]
MQFRNLRTVLMVPLLLFTLSAVCQETQVSGTVIDAMNKSPLAGVTVVANGTSTGTATDANGVFKLSIPATVTTLAFSYVGYVTREVPVGNGNLQVALHVSSASLNELVVIGYGTQQKKDLTGAIATVNAKDFQKGAITSPDQLIAGKISGVTVTSNGGAPGSGSTIRIRGLASLNGNKDPLIVIDGVPLAPSKDQFGTPTIAGIADPLSLINPNDIASITVLKDASAAAIYGSRASAGVILITTKKGQGGRARFNFNTSLSFSMIPREVDVLSPKQFRTYVNTYGDSSHQALLGSASTDWQKEIYRTAVTTNNNLSISGTLKNMPYRVSIGYLDQQGILKTDKLSRTSASVKLNPVLLDGHLRIDLNLTGSLSESRFGNQSAIISSVQFDPTQPIYKSGSPFGGYWEWVKNGILNPLAPRNPVALLYQKHDLSHANRSFGNVEFNYSLPMLPELHAILNLGYDVSKGKGTVNIPGNAAQSWATTTNHGSNSQYLQKRQNTVGEFSLNYVKELAAIKSNINATAGYGYYNNLTTSFNYATLDSKGDTIPGTAPVYPFDKPENTLISYYGRLIYTYNEKYILTASIRRDGSSRFSPKERWGVFPALALAWRMDQENFLKDSKTISAMKLRLSYGVTGNQEGIGNYSYLPDYSLGNNASQYQFGDKYYYMATPAPYVANFTWEQTASTNVGLDYGFLQNRINGSIDYY